MKEPEKLGDAEVARINAGHCPDCNHRGFVLGPRGGNSVNVECGNLACRARFNLAQASFSHHVFYAHRIQSQRNGGADWGSTPQ